MNPELIVRALAAKTAPLGVESGWDEGVCFLCGAGEDREDTALPEHHKPDCPWRLAREWVAAHPA